MYDLSEVLVSYESLSITHPSYRIPYLTKRDRVTLPLQGAYTQEIHFQTMGGRERAAPSCGYQGYTLTIVSGSVF